MFSIYKFPQTKTPFSAELYQSFHTPDLFSLKMNKFWIRMLYLPQICVSHLLELKKNFQQTSSVMSSSLSLKRCLGNISKHTQEAYFHHIPGVTQGEQPCAHKQLLKTSIVLSYTHLYTAGLMTGGWDRQLLQSRILTQVTLSRGDITPSKL